MADQDNVVRRPDRPALQNPKMAAPAMGNTTPPDSGEEGGFFQALGRLLMKHNPGDQGDAQNHAQGGLTRKRKIDSMVDEAVSGAKDDPI